MADDLGEGIADVIRRAEATLGATLRDPRHLEGGHSGVTLVAELDPSKGAEERVVIKATPPGRKAVGRHDVLRQARAIAYAAAAVPVPEILATSADDPPFFVMSFETGEAAEPAHDAASSGDDQALVAQRFAAATGLLARLHALDPSPLLDAGTAPVSPEDELAKWERTLGAVTGDFRVAGEEAFHLLSARIPDLWRAAFVHGDFRLGNILFTGPDPVAVIDWEIWSVGDPRVDLGWYLTFCDPRDFPVIGFPERRLPPAAEVVAAYERATGTLVPDLSWFLAFGAFKMGVVMAHNRERHLSGRHVDPFQETLPPTIEHLLGRAASLASSEVA